MAFCLKRIESNFLIITIIFNVFGDLFPFLENENGRQLHLNHILYYASTKALYFADLLFFKK